MKKSIVSFLLLALPLTLCAQSTWELPPNATTTSASRSEAKQAAKAAKGQTVTVEKDGKSYVVVVADQPYLEGAVPEEDGKVVFTADIATPTLTVDEAYQKAYDFMDALAHERDAADKSKVALVDPQEHTIVGTYTERLYFHKQALQTDFALFNYVVIATCSEGTVSVRLERLTYDYTRGKDTDHILADNTITDKLMLTNDGTKLKKLNSKFRRATVDRMRAVISACRQALE